MGLPDFYREIVEQSPDSIWVTDLQGQTLYANEAFARLYGLPVDQITSITVFDTLDDVGAAQYAEHLRQVAAGRANQEDVEVLFRDVHGTGSWVTVRESLMYDDGVPVALVNRLHSYVDQRHVLDELRASREALEEAQDLARLGSWAYDVASQKVTRFAGLRVGDVHARPRGFRAFLALVHPEDRAHLQQFARTALASAGEFEVDIRVGAGDGWVHLRIRGVVQVGSDGRPMTISGTHQDITEMRLTEIALRDEVVQNTLMRQITAAANAARTLDEVLDTVTPILSSRHDWVRCAAFRVTGDATLEPIGQDPWIDEEQLCRLVLQGSPTAWSEDLRTVAFRVETDDHVWAVAAISASRPVGRRSLVEEMVESVAVQLVRVAEREESAHSLSAARDAAMEASRQKSDFLATMSHEIRTPLNGIIGLTDLLRRTPLEPDQQRLISGMQAASHTLLTVLNDVLDFSKIDGRPVELEKVDVDVRSLVDQVTRVLSGAARAGGVELVVWCDRSVPSLVLSDPTRLSQVLMNLISNAVKFSSGGEVLIRVVAVDSDAVRACLRFEVADNGIGIEPEQLDRLFEPFTQADASTTRRFGGTGLGLSIAREITSAMGGEITYAPNTSGGSIFSFSVWCDRLTDGATDLDDYARTWLAGRRVLVADSSSLRAPALRDQLQWWKVDVDVAADGPSATDLLARSLQVEEPYEAVLIDARLAGGSMELVSAIADDTAYDEVAMIVIGSDLEVDLDRLREAGVSVFLDRPVSGETLRGTLLEQLVGVPSQPMGRPETPVPGSDRPRVLVVEDNIVNQLVANGLLASLGYRVEIAHNGADALEVLARASFDAVLMDVQMPVLDGYAATRTLREREAGGAHLPVIAMTAAAIPGERERCLEAGMDDFLTKPVDRTALAETLARWIAGREEPSSPSAAQPLVAAKMQVTLPATAPIAGLDTVRLDMLRDLDPGDTSYLDRAIANFTTNSLCAETDIADLVAGGDATGVKGAAHKIAGSALNLGVTRAGLAARALELLADTGTTHGAAELLPELHEAMAEGRALLAGYRTTYSST